MVNARDPEQNLILKNREDHSYEDDKFCVTRYCFNQQEKEMETGEVELTSGISLTYTQIAGLIIVPLAIALLLGIGNLIIPLAPPPSRKCCPGWKPLVGKMLFCWIMTILPTYFFFTGFFFAFTLGTSDGCTSGPGVLTTYVRAMGDDMCTQLGGRGTLRECVISSDDISVPVDILSMVETSVGQEQCSDNSQEDPFYLAISTLGKELRTKTRTSANKRVNKHAYRKYRPPVKNIVVNAAESTGKVAANFMDNVGLDVVSCSNVADILKYFKEPVCYSSVGPTAWLLSMLYLACWSLCCMGIPAACLSENHYRWLQIEAKQAADAAALLAEDGEGSDACSAEGGAGGSQDGGEGGRFGAETPTDEESGLRGPASPSARSATGSDTEGIQLTSVFPARPMSTHTNQLAPRRDLSSSNTQYSAVLAEPDSAYNNGVSPEDAAAMQRTAEKEAEYEAAYTVAPADDDYYDDEDEEEYEDDDEA
jgi:hypothetical protein